METKAVKTFMRICEERNDVRIAVRMLDSISYHVGSREAFDATQKLFQTLQETVKFRYEQLTGEEKDYASSLGSEYRL